MADHPQSFWLPTYADLERQCERKIREAENEFWKTIAQSFSEMFESMWAAAQEGEAITLQHGADRITLTPAERGGER